MFSGRYSTFGTIWERRSRVLDSVVTSDETWVHYFTPESKIASGNTPILHPQPKKKWKNFFRRGW
jgi:hypothetical protein